MVTVNRAAHRARFALRAGLLIVLVATVLPAPETHASSRSSSASPNVASHSAVKAAQDELDAGAITFDEFPEETWITDQYLDRGVQFVGDAFITHDDASDTAPVLSGYPKFHGSLTARFTVPGSSQPATVLGFSLDVGFIDDRNSVEIEYFDAVGNSLGTTRAQSYGMNHIEVAGRGIASFVVQKVSYEAAGFGIDNLAVRRTAFGSPPTRVASLGDSYSSGEGLLPEDGLSYDCGTDLHEALYYENTSLPLGRIWLNNRFCQIPSGSSERPSDLYRRKRVKYFNLCHRHRRAYPNQIRARLGVSGSNGIFLACSGATTANIGLVGGAVAQYPASPFGVHGGVTQVENLRDFAAAGPPDLITVGIGGNDANFVGIVSKCILDVFDSCVEGEFPERTISTINGTMFGAVRDTLAGLKEEFGGATIVAFGYPGVIDDPTQGCVRGISEDEWSWVKYAVLPTVNDAIRDAATEAGVAYADITAATEGHGICSSDPWVNGVRLGNDKFGVIGNESFHPNQRAHDAITKLFIDRYTDGEGRLLLSNPAASDPIRPETGPEIRIGQITTGAVENCGASCLQPAACVQTCSVHVQGAGFSPDTVLTATMRSDPIVLGQVITDSAGNVSADLPLPPGAPVGLHSLTLEGSAEDGTTQYGIQLFRIYDRAPVKFRVRFKRGKRGTRVRTLKVLNVPVGGSTEVMCGRGKRALTEILLGEHHRRSGGCPFVRRSFSSGHKLGRKFKRPLKPRTVVRVLATAPQVGGRSLEFVVRKRKRPQLSRACLDPGENVPETC